MKKLQDLILEINELDETINLSNCKTFEELKNTVSNTANCFDDIDDIVDHYYDQFLNESVKCGILEDDHDENDDCDEVVELMFDSLRILETTFNNENFFVVWN